MPGVRSRVVKNLPGPQKAGWGGARRCRPEGDPDGGGWGKRRRKLFREERRPRVFRRAVAIFDFIVSDSGRQDKFFTAPNDGYGLGSKSGHLLSAGKSEAKSNPLFSPNLSPVGVARAGISAPNPGLISKSLSGYHGPYSAPSAPRPGFASEPCSPATTLMPAQGDPDKKDPLFLFPFSFFPLPNHGPVGVASGPASPRPHPSLPCTSLFGYHGPSSAPSAPRPGFANEPCSPATTLMPAQGDPDKKDPLSPFFSLFLSPTTAPSGSPRAGISAPNPGLISKSLSGYHGPFSAPSAPRPSFANEPCSPATTLMPVQGDLDKKDPLFPFPSSLFFSFFSPSPGPGLKGAPPSQPTIIQQKTAPPPSGSGAASFIQAITLKNFQPPTPFTTGTVRRG